MIFLLLSILSSTFIYLTFKLLDKKNVNTLYAIVVNYYSATVFGYITLSNEFSVAEFLVKPWFGGATILGILYITTFVLIGITAQRHGLSVVSVAQRMSLVIPIAFIILYYNEPTGILKFLGILLALVAVYLVSSKNKELNVSEHNLFLPFVLFIGSGVTETLIKYLEENSLAENDIALFSMSIFLFAGIIGTVVGLYQYIVKRVRFTYKEIIGGLLLGIPNYFSVYFFVSALKSDLGSTVVFTLNNVSIVVVATLLGISFFGEKLLRKNWIGIILAIISIILIAITTNQM
ncbi:glucose uptake protein GlcU [Balneicella halophila]|uniref:Glucose uptake protein GlcU n=1 Tax=Balneicella halophila TaxID=1537566 RepID=A0A7L4UPQ7_BALHA|nr:GRP family sugar transporter [Balneicella halophila]PVX50033.1 glucose uptake protein GlcU [Balneicella halophila]